MPDEPDETESLWILRSPHSFDPLPAPAPRPTRAVGITVLRSTPTRSPTVRLWCTWRGGFCPQPSVYISVQNYAVVEHDRIDSISSRFLGDPLLFWMICDANTTTDPDELTLQKGRSILIPLASAIPAGARNG